MKRYFVKYYADFANTYHVVYTVDKKQAAQALAAGYEQITRAHAEALCRAERDRVKYDTAFAGRASDVIAPFDLFDQLDRCQEDPNNERRFRRVGYILERV